MIEERVKSYFENAVEIPSQWSSAKNALKESLGFVKPTCYIDCLILACRKVFWFAPGSKITRDSSHQSLYIS